MCKMLIYLPCFWKRRCVPGCSIVSWLLHEGEIFHFVLQYYKWCVLHCSNELQLTVSHLALKNKSLYVIGNCSLRCFIIDFIWSQMFYESCIVIFVTFSSKIFSMIYMNFCVYYYLKKHMCKRFIFISGPNWHNLTALQGNIISSLNPAAACAF